VAPDTKQTLSISVLLAFMTLQRVTSPIAALMPLLKASYMPLSFLDMTHLPYHRVAEQNQALHG